MMWIVICVDLVYDETFILSRHRFKFAAHLKAWLKQEETVSCTVAPVPPRAWLLRPRSSGPKKGNER